MIPTTILIGSVLVLMLAGTCTLAFVHGWQDGPDNRQDRHQWIPRAFYAAGWRAKRVQADVARRELEQARADLQARQARSDAMYAVLDAAVKDELHRKDQRR